MIRLNLSKREIYFLTVTVIIVMLSLTCSFIFAPLFKNWDIVNNEIIIKKIKFRKGSALLENRDTIIKEYNSYAVSLKDISKILSYIERKGNSLGIKTANIKPKPLVQKEFYTEYVIELQIEGTLADINRFVSQLISSPISITLKKFDLRMPTSNSTHFKGTLILSKLII